MAKILSVSHISESGGFKLGVGAAVPPIGLRYFSISRFFPYKTHSSLCAFAIQYKNDFYSAVIESAEAQ